MIEKAKFHGNCQRYFLNFSFESTFDDQCMKIIGKNVQSTNVFKTLIVESAFKSIISLLKCSNMKNYYQASHSDHENLSKLRENCRKYLWQCSWNVAFSIITPCLCKIALTLCLINLKKLVWLPRNFAHATPLGVDSSSGFNKN